MKRHWSFRTRFVLTATLCLLPLLVVLFYVVQESLDESRQKTIENEVIIGDVIAKNVAQALDENVVVLTDIASIEAVRALDAQQAPAVLGQFLRARPSLYGIILVAADGTVIASSGNLEPEPVLPLLRNELDVLFTVGEPTTSGLLSPSVSEGSGTVGLLVPVRVDPAASETGVPVGAVIGLLNIERLGRSFASAFSFAENDTVAAVVDDGNVIVAQTNTETANDTLIDDLSAPITAAVAGKRSNLTYETADGEERVAVFAPIDYIGANWAVVVSNPAPTVTGGSRDFVLRTLAALGLAVLFTLALATLLGELVSRPVRKLTTQASAIAHGDYSRRVEPAGSGEFGDLSEAVAEMADRLTTQVRDLDAARIEVAAQAERLRDLLRRTVRLQEDERRRIAGDIHDAVSPLITGALYQTRALQLGGGNGDADADANGVIERDVENLAAISNLLERAMDELHSVIFALRPPDLDDLGVEAAIERYVQQIDRNGLPCRLEVVGEQRRLSAEARLAVYRIVQEALHNALRHAHADEALVRMEWTDDLFRVTISDNGSGFDPDQVTNAMSLGLLSMRERAASIGASFIIASQPGDGTLLVIERPHGQTVTVDGAEAAVEQISGSGWSIATAPMGATGR